MRPSDSCSPVSPDSFGSSDDTSAHPPFRSPVVRMRPPRPGAITARLTQAECEVTEETNRSPRFLGNPKVTAPTSQDPGGTALPGQYRRAGAAPTCAHGRGSHDETNFGAGWAGSDTRCLRFARGGHPTRTQDSLPAVGQTLPGGLSSHWVPPKGFELFPTSLPLSQASPGASARRVRHADALSGVACGPMTTRTALVLLHAVRS
jgi:hypothetical protein